MIRFRHVLLILGTICLFGVLFLTDPDKGTSTAMWILGAASGIFAVALAHISRKGLFDYIDMEKFAKKAYESPAGAGAVFVGMCVVLASLLNVFSNLIK